MNKLDLYYKLPPPIRNAAVSLWGTYLRWWRYGANTEPLIEEALARETWSYHQWKTWQENRLAYMLHLSATRVPYYRQMWAERRRAGDRASWEVLENWPLLEKKVVRENPQAFISEFSKKKKLYTDHTGGTTGQPTLIYESRKTITEWYALNEARTCRWYGVSRSEPWAIFGGQKVVPLHQSNPPYWIWNRGLNQLYLSIFHINQNTAKDYVDELRRYKPTHMVVYPSSLAVLAGWMIEQKLEPPRLKVIISNSEKILPGHKHLIEEAFGCRIVDTYGMAELTAAASECPAGGLHFWPESGWLEVYDQEHNQFLKGDTAVGNLVMTGLFNEDMPLIRYRNGDLGSLPQWNFDCGCGRHLPGFRIIQGRENDLLRTPDGRKLYLLDSLFNGFPVIEVQLVQNAQDQFVVNLVPGAGYQTSEVQAGIQQRLLQYLGLVQIEFVEMDCIPRNVNGKFKPFISNLEPGI